jgi:TRAP-type C4-dicarboxylate transport system substrate-binding protein
MPFGPHSDEQCLKNLEKQGCTIVPVDYEIWRAKLRSTYPNFYKQFGKDLIEEILATR